MQSKKNRIFLPLGWVVWMIMVMAAVSPVFADYSDFADLEAQYDHVSHKKGTEYVLCDRCFILFLIPRGYKWELEVSEKRHVAYHLDDQNRLCVKFNNMYSCWALLKVYHKRKGDYMQIPIRTPREGEEVSQIAKYVYLDKSVKPPVFKPKNTGPSIPPWLKGGENSPRHTVKSPSPWYLEKQFSLQGGLSGKDKKHFAMTGEFILNASHRWGWLAQGACKVDIQQNIKQYGFSVGGGYEPGDLGVFLFLDGLSYKFGEYKNTFHLQLRPTVRWMSRRVTATLFYAHGIGDRYTGVDKLVTPDYKVSVYNKSLKYFGVSVQALLLKKMFVKAEALAATKGKAYKLDLEAGYEVLDSLHVTARVQMSDFGNYPGLAMQGFSNTTRFGIGVQYRFGDSVHQWSGLRNSKIVPVAYPLVVSYEKKVIKEKDPSGADPEEPDKLRVTLSASPGGGKAPLNVDFSATVQGGESPYRYRWYFKGKGSGQMVGGNRESFTYYKKGSYNVVVEVEDAKGTIVESNPVKIEVSASDRYTIEALAHEGAKITPSGSILAQPGSDYTFEISALDGYKVSRVKVDGKNLGALSQYTFKDISSDHKIEAWAENDDGTKQYKIVSSSGNGGSNDPEGTILVDKGKDLEVWIVADPGYKVKDVRVDGKSRGAITSYRFEDVDKDHTIESTFEASTFKIEAFQNSGGSISPPGITQVGKGGSVNYTISVFAGNQLTDLLVDGRSVGVPSGNTYTFMNVQSDHTIEPVFGQKTLTISATSGTGGRIIESGDVRVVYGDSKAFNFIPQEGWEIKEVRVDGTVVPVPSGNSYTFSNVTTDHTIHVTFKKVEYTITVIKNNGGTVSPTTTTVAHGEDVSFSISANQGYEISNVRVDGGSCGSLSSYTFKNVTSDHLLEVVFTLKTFAIEVVCDEGSMATPGTTQVTYGENRTFNFSTVEGKVISDVLVDGVSKGSQSSWTFNDIREDHRIELKAEWQTFEISETHDVGGRVIINGQVNPGKVSIKWGEDVTLRFEADETVGKALQDVTLDGQSKGIISTYTLKAVKENHSVHLATQWRLLTISETHGSGGRVTLNGQVNPGSIQVRWGESVTCSFTADENQGRQLESVTIDGRNRGVITSWTFSEVKDNHAINLETSWIYFTVSESHESGGQVIINGQLNPGTVSVRWGQAVSMRFDANSSSGKEIQDVQIDGTSKGTITSFEIPAIRSNHSVYLALKWKSYTIQASHGSNGTIAPGTSIVRHGEDITFSIIPNFGFLVDTVIVDGVSLTGRTQYTFANVTANHSIHATFKRAPLPKHDVTYGGYDFAWKDGNLVPNNGTGGGGPETTIQLEQGQLFQYTYPSSVKDPELPLQDQFDIPFQYVEINGTRYYSRNVSITITTDTIIRAYYYIDRTP